MAKLFPAAGLGAGVGSSRKTTTIPTIAAKSIEMDFGLVAMGDPRSVMGLGYQPLLGGLLR